MRELHRRRDSETTEVVLTPDQDAVYQTARERIPTILENLAEEGQWKASYNASGSGPRVSRVFDGVWSGLEGIEDDLVRDKLRDPDIRERLRLEVYRAMVQDLGYDRDTRATKFRYIGQN